MRLVEMIATFTYTPSDVDAFYNNMINNAFDLSTGKYRSTATFNRKDHFNAWVDNGSIESTTIEKIESDTKVRMTVNWYSAADWKEFSVGNDQRIANLSSTDHSSMTHMHLRDRIDNGLVIGYFPQVDPATQMLADFTTWVLTIRDNLINDLGKSSAFANIQLVNLNDDNASYAVPAGGWQWSDWS